MTGKRDDFQQGPKAVTKSKPLGEQQTPKATTAQKPQQTSKEQTSKKT